MTANEPQPAGAAGLPSGDALTVNDVVRPLCECGAPLTTRDELNRMIDWQVNWCDACCADDQNALVDECWCVYGWFMGGDPRQFQPDEENQPSEIEAWRAACEAWAAGVPINPGVEEHGPWVEPPTGRVTIGERPSPEAIGRCSAPRAYGLGAIHCDKHRAPHDAWRSWPTHHELEPLATASEPALLGEGGEDAS